MKLVRILIISLAVFAGLGGISHKAMAQPGTQLAFYSFTGIVGSEASAPADAQPANAVFKPFMRGDSLQTTNPTANVFAANAWGQGTAVNANRYFTFGFTANTGYKVRIDSLIFGERRSSTGPNSISIRTSLDGYTADVDTLGLPNNTLFRTRRINLGGATFTNLNNLDFRIYGYGATAGTGTWRMDDVKIVGAIIASNPTATFSPILPYKSRNAITGVADSVGKIGTVRGIVYGVNTYNPTTGGVQFTIIDATAGINVRMAGNTSYTVTEGDEVEITGALAQFRGLIQFNATAVTRLSQGNALKSPIVSTAMDYPLVSDLVRFNGLTLVAGTWPTTPTGTGFSAKAVRVATGTDTVYIRVIPQTADIWASTAPVGTFDLIGLGGQFTTPSSSTLGGLQISPRRLSDIIPANPLSLVATPTALTNFGSVAAGSTSAQQSYVIRGRNLTAAVAVTAPGGFELSLTSNTFTPGNTTLSLPLLVDSIATTTVYVRFAPSLVSVYSGNITHVSGSNTANVTVGGTGTGTVATFSPILPYKSRNAITGVADSVGKVGTVRGIVYGVNTYNPTTGGVQFSIIDATAGINVRMAGNTAYTVTEGDEVEVTGALAQFRGLIQFNATAVTRLSQNNTLKSPIVSTAMDYPLVSDLVRFNGLTLVARTWPATPTGSGFTAKAIRVATGTDTVYIRVVPQTADIWAAPAPGGVFDLIALGGQFTTPSSSSLGGFQVSPRRLSDIIPVAQPTNLVAFPAVIPSFGQVLVGSTSPQFYYTVRGTGLTAPVDVTAPAGFEVSLTAGTFVSGNRTVSIPLVADSIRSTRVYTRFAPTAVQAYSGVVTNVSGTNTFDVAISGTGISSIGAYTIGQVTTRRPNGVGDSVGIRCTLRGKVYGVNTITRLPGAQFTMIDYTGGINVRIARPTSYNVTEGDSVSVTGLISQFRGLIQIAPDTITLVSQGNALRAPRAVNKGDLSTVNDFIVIEPLVLVPGTWPAAPAASFNARAVNTNTNDTTTIRVLRETADVFQMAAPTGPFRLFALGSQFSPSTAVSLGGYQVSPRTIADIVPINALVNTVGARSLTAYPNPTASRLAIALPSNQGSATLQFVSMTGQVLASTTVDAAALAQGISVSSLPRGVYQAIITQGNDTFRAKFVKE